MAEPTVDPIGAEDRERPETAPPTKEQPALPLESIRDRVVEMASAFLSPRDAGGGTSPLEGLGALGQKADSMVRSFMRGFGEPTQDDTRAGAEGHGTPATELVGLVLSRASQAVSHGFHAYLSNHAERSGSGEVVVDGRFLWKHGAPLISSVVDALGRQVSRALEPSPEAERGSVKVDYRIDFPSILGALLQRATNDAPREDESPDAPREDESPMGPDEPPEDEGAPEDN